jgi:hypothetical protein
MYAAWLPRYDPHTGQEDALLYPDHSLPQHGDPVTCWLVEVTHHSGRFRFWGVRAIFQRGQVAGRPDNNCRQADGYVCITNRNIDRKHDERVFFTTRNEPVLHPLTEDLRRQWRELITNYQVIHEEERRSGMIGPPALSNSVWSRQVVAGPGERQLAAGTLCYAAFRDGLVTALYPVMISRRLFESSPLTSLQAVHGGVETLAIADFPHDARKIPRFFPTREFAFVAVSEIAPRGRTALREKWAEQRGSYWANCRPRALSQLQWRRHRTRLLHLPGGPG